MRTTVLNSLKPYQRTFLVSLLITLLYCVSRFFIYSMFPDSDFHSWVYRDFIMNLPRIVCLGLAVLLTFKTREQRRDLLPNISGIKKAVTIGILLILPLLVRSIFFESQLLSKGDLFLFVLSSFVVGFFEEALFRGSMFNSLRGWLGWKSAIWYSSFVFMIFHVQAQDIIHFPLIFLFGILYALLRRDGVSLFLIAMIHSIYDVLVIFGNPPVEARVNWEIFECALIILFILGYLKFAPKLRTESRNGALGVL